MNRSFKIITAFFLVTASQILSPISAKAEFTYLKVNLVNFSNTTAADRDRVNKAIDLMEQVVNTDTFRNKVLHMPHAFTQTTDTAIQILSKIIRARENFSGGTDNVIDFFLTMYNAGGNVIGYTSVNDRYIHMNRTIQKNYSPASSAANLFHEWMHKIGYDHSFEYNAARPYSVPYALGYEMGTEAARLASGGSMKAMSEFQSEFISTLGQDCPYSHRGRHHR